MKFIFKFLFLLTLYVFSTSFIEEEKHPESYYCFNEIPTEVGVDYEEYLVDQEFCNSNRRIQNSKDVSLLNYYDLYKKSVFFNTQSVLNKNSYYIYLVEPILSAHRLNLYLFKLF